MTCIIFTHKDAESARKAIDTLWHIGDDSGISEFGDEWDNAISTIRRIIDDAEWGMEVD